MFSNNQCGTNTNSNQSDHANEPMDMDAKAKSLPNLRRKRNDNDDDDNDSKYYYSSTLPLYCLDDIAFKHRMEKSLSNTHPPQGETPTTTMLNQNATTHLEGAMSHHASTPASTTAEASAIVGMEDDDDDETAQQQQHHQNAPPLTTHFSSSYHLPPPPPMAATSTMIPHAPGAFRMSLRNVEDWQDDEDVESTDHPPRRAALSQQQPHDSSTISPLQPPPQQQRRVSFADPPPPPSQSQHSLFPAGASTEPPLLVPYASIVVSQDSREQQHHSNEDTMLVLGEPQPWYLKRRVYLRVLFGTCTLAVIGVIALTVILLVIKLGRNSRPSHSNNTTTTLTPMTFPTLAPTPLARGGILWQQVASVRGMQAGDKFGWSVVAVMDSTDQTKDTPEFYWAAGSPFCEASDGTVDAGCIYVYQVDKEEENSTTFANVSSNTLRNLPLNHAGNASIQGEGESATLGWSVAMTAVNGNLIVAAGAPQNSIYGYVRVYRYDLTASHSPLTPSWIQMGQDLSGDSLPGNFGTNVALSSDGRILAVACDEYSNGVAGHFGGQVQVYCYDCEQEFTTTNPMWALLGSPLEGSENTELFGYSIALSSNGTILAVGSIGYSDKHGSQEGRVQVFEFQNNSWQLVGDPLTGQAGPFFLGSSVALSSDGSILATGAISGADNAGLVRVYQLNKTANMWTQMGTDIVGSSPNDFFGTAVSLSADGAKLAATADQHGGSRIGYARVYQYTNQSKDWQQIGQDLLGSEPGEQLGESIALTADGGYVIVGAPYPTSLNDSGVAFIYRATSDNN